MPSIDWIQFFKILSSLTNIILQPSSKIFKCRKEHHQWQHRAANAAGGGMVTEVGLKGTRKVRKTPNSRAPNQFPKTPDQLLFLKEQRLKPRNSEVSQLSFFWLRGYFISSSFLLPTRVAISGPEINQYIQEALSTESTGGTESKTEEIFSHGFFQNDHPLRGAYQDW